MTKQTALIEGDALEYDEADARYKRECAEALRLVDAIAAQLDRLGIGWKVDGTGGYIRAWWTATEPSRSEVKNVVHLFDGPHWGYYDADKVLEYVRNLAQDDLARGTFWEEIAQFEC